MKICIVYIEEYGKAKELLFMRLWLLFYVLQQTLPFDGCHGACALNCEVTGGLHGARVGRSWAPTYKDIITLI